MSAAMNDPVAAVLDAPLTALRKDGLGFVGPDVSIDLLLASGRPFGHLPWNVAGATPFADQWLESSFPGWSRSILQQWHEGAFDGLHAVVFSRSDDASQRLYYYVRELQQRGLLQGPRPLILDLALVPRESSFEHSAASVALLARDLGIDDDALRAGVARADALRLKLGQMQLHRAADGAYLRAPGARPLWSDPTEWIDAVPAARTRRQRRAACCWRAACRLMKDCIGPSRARAAASWPKRMCTHLDGWACRWLRPQSRCRASCGTTTHRHGHWSTRIPRSRRSGSCGRRMSHAPPP